MTCQTLINDILTGYLNIYTITYLDNILIYSENLKDHRKHIKDVLKQLLTKQLRCKSEKYKFYRKKWIFSDLSLELKNTNQSQKTQESIQLIRTKKSQRSLRIPGIRKF